MQKMYRTKSKDNIMAYLQSHEAVSFSAYDVHSYMQQNHIAMNLTTIYRNLDKLTESGIVVKYKSADEEVCKYQYVKQSSNCQEHIHMQCRQCGKMFHLECDFMDEISKHLMEHHGFNLECSGSMLIGICEECKDKISTSK